MSLQICLAIVALLVGATKALATCDYENGTFAENGNYTNCSDSLICIWAMDPLTQTFRKDSFSSRLVKEAKKRRLYFDKVIKNNGPNNYAICKVNKSLSSFKSSTLQKAFKNLNQKQRKRIQTNLKSRRLYSSTIDGMYGDGTAEALNAYNMLKFDAADLKKSNNVRKLINAVLALDTKKLPGVLAECSIDPNECTPKQLCKVATKLQGSNTIWSMETGSVKHVTTAQGLGMNCGVIAILGPCDSDPNECKISQLCEKATKRSNGQTFWNEASQAHVDLAKEYELTCDVKIQTTSVEKTCSTSTPAHCTAAFICASSTIFTNRLKTWRTSGPLLPYVKEAENRGLACGVKDQSDSSSVEKFKKSDFMKLALYQRKQIQYGLKVLGYHKNSIDGVWGPSTQKAIKGYVTDKRIKNDYPFSLLKRLILEVKMPASFENSSSTKPVATTKPSKKVEGNKIYKCTRLNLPMRGFTSRSGAEYWYPKKLSIAIAADESWMATYYGTDKKRSDWSKRNKHFSKMKGMHLVSVSGKTLNDMNKSIIWVGLGTSSSKMGVGQAKYECSKAAITSWKPD